MHDQGDDGRTWTVVVREPCGGAAAADAPRASTTLALCMSARGVARAKLCASRAVHVDGCAGAIQRLAISTAWTSDLGLALQIAHPPSRR